MNPRKLLATTATATMSLLMATAVTTALLVPTPAKACGGFFCNAQTQSPIFQAGERVLFVKHGPHVTMHIEVTYGGDPTEFAWLIPVPAVPRDVTGQPLPLGQVLGLSSQMLFPTLQAATNPVWMTSRGPSEGTLCSGGSSSGGCADMEGLSLAGSFDSAPNSQVEPTDPGIVVSDKAKVGPYNAELIEATSSDALFTWLGNNGYYQDPAAKPLLAHYVSQGFSFVGIRLQNGKAVGDIKPVALTLGENAPCVPLRLTSIAAIDGMPIRVWVLGEGRAVPKNFLHAVVNEQAIMYPGGENYNSVVDAAIEAAGGRAFVTEAAIPVDPLRSQLFPGHANATSIITAVNAATTNLSAINPVRNAVGADNIDLDQLIAESETMELDTLKKRLVDEVITPLANIESLLKEGSVLTRLYTRIDPKNMTRDPIFAFNPALPDVPVERMMEGRSFTDEECDTHTILYYPDGRRRTIDNLSGQTVSFEGASALGRLEVLDETGEPVPVSLASVEEIDALMDTAVAGTPTLTPAAVATYEAETIPDAFVAPPGYEEIEGCTVGGSNATAFIIALCCGLLWWRRRRFSQSTVA